MEESRITEGELLERLGKLLEQTRETGEKLALYLDFAGDMAEEAERICRGVRSEERANTIYGNFISFLNHSVDYQRAVGQVQAIFEIYGEKFPDSFQQRFLSEHPQGIRLVLEKAEHLKKLLIDTSSFWEERFLKINKRG